MLKPRAALAALAALALSPVVLVQALWVGARVQRLPEAGGPRSGQQGDGPPLRLLLVGDSSAAGVGVEHQSSALIGQIAKTLTPHVGLSWQVVAKSGGTALSTLRLLEDMRPAPCDIAVVVLGVNDSKNGVRARPWNRDYGRLIDTLHNGYGAQHVYVCALPDFTRFPLLPRPLRGVLAWRATVLDHALRALCTAKPNVHYAAVDAALVSADMARDGFHPGPKIYAQWGRGLGEILLRDHGTGFTRDPR